jgi:hypothetical protein
MGKGKEIQPKKTYQPPALTVYGKVQELTQKVGFAKTLDGGGGFRNRTSLH